MKKSCLLRTIILAGGLLLHPGLLCFHSRGAAGDVDLSFDPGSGINGTVNAVVVQPDGKVLIGGEFTTVRGLARPGLARLNADGSGDSSFAAGAFALQNRTVYSLALQPDGKVLAGHLHGFTRLLSDGSMDPDFSLGETATIDWINGGFYDGAVYCGALQPDGKLLIGGRFDWVNGTVVNLGLARLNVDGTLDTGFNVWPGFYEQQVGQVRSVAVQTDGKVLVVGDWNPVSSARHGIFRLNADGSLDSSFNPGIGIGSVSVVASQPDGKVLLGGYPLTVNGTNIASGIARIETNGSLDSGFNPGSGTYGGLRSIALLPDGKMLLGGGFTSIGGPNHIARLNPDGSQDTSFNPGTGANGPVSSIVLQSNGQVLMAGTFASGDGTSRNRMARLNADGSLDGTFDPGRSLNAVTELVLQPDGKVLIGGSRTVVRNWDVLFGTDLTFINGTNRYGRDRLHPNGSLDGTFISSTFNPDYPDLGLCPGPGFECSQSWVASVVRVQPNGKVLVGGYHSTVGFDLSDNYLFYHYRRFLARFHADGSRDTNFAPVIGPLMDVPLGVSALAVQPDGKVLIGGYAVLARINADGSPDNSFNPGTGTFAGGVTSVALQADGKVLIGGPGVHGTNVSYGIARLHADGSLDSSFNPGTGASGDSVSSVALQPDGKVLIGGSFTSFSGTPRNGIARLNADGSMDFSLNPGTGADGPVRSITVQPDGNLLIGGDFLTVNGVVRPYVVRLHGNSTPPSFAAWALGHGLTGAAAASDADPDHDGLSNGVEYVLGGNPAAPASLALLGPTVAVSADNLLFTFPRADASETSDVTLTVETGTDLTTWPAVFTIGPDTAASSPGVTISENGASADTVTVTVPNGTATRLFARLSVAIVP